MRACDACKLKKNTCNRTGLIAYIKVSVLKEGREERSEKRELELKGVLSH